MKKQILSLLLCAAMLLTPMTAQAKTDSQSNKAETKMEETAKKTTKKKTKKSTASKKKPAAQKTAKKKSTAKPAAKKSSSSKKKGNSVVKMINDEREKEGMSALKEDEQLMKMAQIRAKELSISYSHERPDGSKYFTVFDDVGEKFVQSVENIGCGKHLSASSVVKMWMESSAHRDNILSDFTKRIGIAHYSEGSEEFWVLIASK